MPAASSRFSREAMQSCSATIAGAASAVERGAGASSTSMPVVDWSSRTPPAASEAANRRERGDAARATIPAGSVERRGSNVRATTIRRPSAAAGSARSSASPRVANKTRTRPAASPTASDTPPNSRSTAVTPASPAPAVKASIISGASRLRIR